MHAAVFRHRPFTLSISFVSLCLIAYWDYVTIHEIDLSLFYLLPVSLTAWYTGRRTGLLFALTAALAWGLADIWEDYAYQLPWGLYWASVNHIIFFTLAAVTLSRLHTAYQTIEHMAHFDALTGLLNRRAFFMLAEKELARSRRYQQPLTVCYLDVDHFKQVNDSRGHEAGDQLLRDIAQALTRQLRQSDLIARLGGDEFALLLPQTGAAAAELLPRLQRQLQVVMDEAGWPVTFSIGAVTCQQVPASLDLLLQQGDALMYEVKKNGKNSLLHHAFQPPPV